MDKKPFLTDDSIKSRYSDEIGKTFFPNGVNKSEAIKYLGSQDGFIYLKMMSDSQPEANYNNIYRRSIEHLMSGRTLPVIEVINEPLVKIVKPGAGVSPHTPYFAKLSDLEALIESGESLSNKLGLPIASESPHYDVYVIRPKGPVEVFVSEIAPTSELDGRVQKEGGARQYLVPNRHQFSEPVLERRLADHISLRHTVPPLDVPSADLVSKQKGFIMTEPANVPPSLRTLGRLGVAAELYDAGQTAHQVAGHYQRDNPLAAESALLHLGGRTAGGLGGVVLGAGAAGAAWQHQVPNRCSLTTPLTCLKTSFICKS